MHLSKRLGTRLGAGVLTAGLLITPALAATGTVTAEDGLRLRAGSSTSSKIITVLDSGTSVEILETVNSDWYRVSVDNREGYVASSYVKVEPEAPAAALPVGTVTASSLNIRSGPGTGYTRVGALAHGTQVTLLEKTGSWYRIEKGYISTTYVSVSETQVPEAAPPAAETTPSAPAVPSVPEVPAAPEQTNLTGLITTASLNIRSGPGTGYSKVGTLASGATVKLLEKSGDWYRIDKGYIHSQYVMIKSDNVSQLQAQIVAFARSLLGKPYVWGGSGPNEFDCSGLTQYIYNHFGYSIYRNATSQLKNGVPVSKENLQPGDLVFFNSSFTGADKASHIGIYIGNGEFIHASGKTLSDGSKRPVVISDLNSTYYTKVYTTARRII